MKAALREILGGETPKDFGGQKFFSAAHIFSEEEI